MLQPPARVTPTVHDVRSLPVPGLSGVAPQPVPQREDRFRHLLQQLLDQKRPAQAPAAQRIPAARPPLRQPTFRPRVGASTPAITNHGRALAAPRAARPTPVAGDSRGALKAAIRQASATAGVEPALSVAVARAESSLNPRARSADGLSVGTFQVTHATAAEMRRKIAAGTVERPPGSDDVALGVGYLRYLHDLFGRSAKLGKGLSTVPVDDEQQRRLFAVAAFNAGEGTVARAQAKATAAGADATQFAEVQPYLPRTTRGYVERVVAYAREELPQTTAV